MIEVSDERYRKVIVWMLRIPAEDLGELMGQSLTLHLAGYDDLAIKIYEEYAHEKGWM